MSKRERVILWVVVGLLGVWLLVLTLMVAGELAAINAVLAGEPAASQSAVAGEPTPWWGGEAGAGQGSQSGPQVGIAGVRWLSDTLAMTVTVRSSGAGDLLYEPPVVVDEAGRVYPADGESLEAARYAFLDLVTRGQAQATLTFAGLPPEGARLTLVFNPDQQPGDLLSPRLEVPVPITAPPAVEATPTPEG